MIKVALIGAGSISKAHCQAYDKLTGVKIIAVADILGKAAEETADRYGAKAYLSLNELLEAERPDMVDICTPTHTHAELAVKALEQKVHVLCEKPMAIDMDGARRMLEASKRNGVLLMIGQVLRFWPEYSYLKKLYDEGTYGRLLKAHFRRIGQSPTWGSWFSEREKSGLSPLDLHVHDADFVFHLLGKPKAVTSFGMPDETGNNYIVTRYIFDGMTVEAEGGWFEAPIPFEMSFWAVFERAAVNFVNGILTLYPSGGQPQIIEWQDRSLQETGINVGTTDAFFNEIKYFTDCIRNNTYPSAASPESTLACLNMLFCEIESARTGKTIAL